MRLITVYPAQNFIKIFTAHARSHNCMRRISINGRYSIIPVVVVAVTSSFVLYSFSNLIPSFFPHRSFSNVVVISRYNKYIIQVPIWHECWRQISTTEVFLRWKRLIDTYSGRRPETRRHDEVRWSDLGVEWVMLFYAISRILHQNEKISGGVNLFWCMDLTFYNKWQKLGTTFSNFNN